MDFTHKVWEFLKPESAAGWNHGAALFLRNQPGALKLFNSGRHPPWDALATGTARVRGRSAFRILSWLEVADFDFAFRFLFLCFVLHVTFHLFVVRAFVDRLAVPVVPVSN